MLWSIFFLGLVTGCALMMGLAVWLDWLNGMGEYDKH